jgi:SAM-dependent methyltransferase
MTATRAFGTGGAEPFEYAMSTGEIAVLYLEDAATRRTSEHRTVFDVSRWHADADAADLSLLDAVTGPVLDVGCGPGRMLRAARGRGLDVLGIDVSPAAAVRARATGAPVLERNVFEPLPGEGEWQSVLLVDGNVGIGGDVSALLARCAELLAPRGEIVVELHADAWRDSRFTAHLTDSRGASSAGFPWAEIGLGSLRLLVPSLGLRVVQDWARDGRVFARLATR